MSSVNGKVLLTKPDYLALGKPDTDSDNTDTSGTDDEGRGRKGSHKAKKKRREKRAKGMQSERVTLFSVGLLKTFAKAV